MLDVCNWRTSDRALMLQLRDRNLTLRSDIRAVRSFARARLWLSSQRLEECRASALSPIKARAGMAAGRAPGLLCTFATSSPAVLARRV